MWMMEDTASPSVMPVQKVYWTHPTQACEYASKGISSYLEQKKNANQKWAYGRLGYDGDLSLATYYTTVNKRNGSLVLAIY